jgi:hypothetical protein
MCSGRVQNNSTALTTNSGCSSRWPIQHVRWLGQDHRTTLTDPDYKQWAHSSGRSLTHWPAHLPPRTSARPLHALHPWGPLHHPAPCCPCSSCC